MPCIAPREPVRQHSSVKRFPMPPGGKMIRVIRSRNGCWYKPALISFANRSEAVTPQNAFEPVCPVYNAFCVAVIVTGPIFTVRSLAGLAHQRQRLPMRMELWLHDPFGGLEPLKFAPMDKS